MSGDGPRSTFHFAWSRHEQISGWTKYIKGTQDKARIVAGYLRLEKILSDFVESQVLPYSLAVSDIFEEIKRQKIRIATMDLRIASIAIAQRMILVTRNTIDFERVRESRDGQVCQNACAVTQVAGLSGCGQVAERSAMPFDGCLTAQ